MPLPQRERNARGRFVATPVAIRFAANVDTSAGPDACHPWTGRVDKGGYGQFDAPDRPNTPAHRYAWELEHGPIPEGMEPDHTCHNGTDCSGGPTCPHRRCCNVRHLEAVNHRDNTRRGVGPTAENARKTHCARGGHPLSGDNLMTTRAGRRRCRTCHAENGRRSYARQNSR